MIGLLGSLVGARGGRKLGAMIGGRHGAMIGGLLGSLVGSRQLGRLARSVTGGGRAGGGLAGGIGNLTGGNDQPAADQQPLDEEAARLLVSLMCNSAKSDGHVDQQEAERITAQLGDDVTADERAFLQQQLASPFLSAAEMAAHVPADLSAEAYAVSLLSIDVDTAEESEYLDNLAIALDLSSADRNEIHEELGLSA